jgi:hypothetical protein
MHAFWKEADFSLSMTHCRRKGKKKAKESLSTKHAFAPCSFSIALASSLLSTDETSFAPGFPRKHAKIYYYSSSDGISSNFMLMLWENEEEERESSNNC